MKRESPYLIFYPSFSFCSIAITTIYSNHTVSDSWNWRTQSRKNWQDAYQLFRSALLFFSRTASALFVACMVQPSYPRNRPRNKEMSPSAVPLRLALLPFSFLVRVPDLIGCFWGVREGDRQLFEFPCSEINTNPAPALLSKQPQVVVWNVYSRLV